MNPPSRSPGSPSKKRKNKMSGPLVMKQGRLLSSPIAQLSLLISSFFISLILFRTPSTLYSPTQSRIYNPPPNPPSHAISNTIVVPAYHERANVRPLVEAVFGALRERDQTEIVIVDDNSQDGTVDEVQKLNKEGYQVELLVRTNENGLSSAVLRGFEVARGHKLVVMDADLQVSAPFAYYTTSSLTVFGFFEFLSILHQRFNPCLTPFPLRPLSHSVQGTVREYQCLKVGLCIDGSFHGERELWRDL